MTFKTNSATVEAIQRIKGVSGFAAKVEAAIAFGCSSRRNAIKAASHCSDRFTSTIEIDIPVHLQNKLTKASKANGLTESAFISGCALVYAS